MALQTFFRHPPPTTRCKCPLENKSSSMRNTPRKSIENDGREETCSQEELEKASQFLSLLGRQGVIPGETDEEL